MPFQRSKNIKFCAYLRLKGIHPNEVEKESKGKATFVYKMDDKEWSFHQIEFNQHPAKYLDYANCMEAIKDMSY